MCVAPEPAASRARCKARRAGSDGDGETRQREHRTCRATRFGPTSRKERQSTTCNRVGDEGEAAGPRDRLLSSIERSSVQPSGAWKPWPSGRLGSAPVPVPGPQRPRAVLGRRARTSPRDIDNATEQWTTDAHPDPAWNLKHLANDITDNHPDDDRRHQVPAWCHGADPQRWTLHLAPRSSHVRHSRWTVDRLSISR